MAIPSYTPTDWENGVTPINEDNLNKIEEQLEAVTDGVNDITSEKDIQTATGTSLTLTDCVADTCKVTSNSKNLFNKKIIEAGYLNTSGAVVSNAEFSVSDYISVSGMSNITISGNSGGNEFIAFYNASKTFVSGEATGTNTTKTIAVPSSAVYVRATVRNTKLDEYQLEEGSTATSYSPYNTEVIVSDENLFDGFLNGAYISTTGVWNGSADGKASKKLSVEKGKEYVLSGYTPGQTIRIFHWNNGIYISDTTLTTASINKIIMLGNQFAFQSSSSASYNNVVFATGQNISLIPNETKSAFTYDTETIVVSNGSVTIEYNTQSRLLNNDDTTAIKEYIDRTAEEKNQDIYSTDEIRIGTWIDGRHLYRKVIGYTIPSGTTAIGISLGVANISLVQRAEVRFNSIGSGDYVFNSYYSGASDYMRFFMRNNELQIRLGSNSSGFNIVAIVEYTKTTD